jgi:hypothetical protein
LTPTLQGGGKTEPVGIAIVALLFLFIFFYKPVCCPTLSFPLLLLSSSPPFLFSSFPLLLLPLSPTKLTQTTPQSWGATTWIYTSEIFSMNVRAQAVGMSSQMQNVANAIFQQFFPTFLAHKGFNTFWFFFAINLVLAAFVWFFLPETKMVPLEEIDVLFGGENHGEKGGKTDHVEDVAMDTFDGKGNGGAGSHDDILPSSRTVAVREIGA